MRLERDADVLPLLRLELEDVQDPRDPHLEEDRGAAAPELHDVTQLCRVEVLFGDRPEEVHLRNNRAFRSGSLKGWKEETLLSDWPHSKCIMSPATSPREGFLLGLTGRSANGQKRGIALGFEELADRRPSQAV